MTTLIFTLMLQYVVSTKAGMVNHVEGNASLKATESAVAGIPITTGTGGYAEILLNPGSFLRLGENSQAAIDNVDLDSIVVRTISGAAIIEVTEIDGDYPITVVSGGLAVEIISSGLYKFEDGKASIITGKLRMKGSSLTYKKGWALSHLSGGVRAAKLARNDNSTFLDTWSEKRSGVISNANVQTVQTFRDDRTLAWERPNTLRNSWVWIPHFGIWTFMPNHRMNSPYGYRYRGSNEYIPVENNPFSVTSENSSGRTANPAQSPSSSNGSSGSSSPANTAPSGGEYSGSKNEPVAATVQ